MSFPVEQYPLFVWGNYSGKLTHPVAAAVHAARQHGIESQIVLWIYSGHHGKQVVSAAARIGGTSTCARPVVKYDQPPRGGAQLLAVVDAAA